MKEIKEKIKKRIEENEEDLEGFGLDKLGKELVQKENEFLFELLLDLERYVIKK